MTNPKRMVLSAVTLALALLLTVAWASAWMLDQRANSLQSASDLRESRQLATAILALQTDPNTAKRINFDGAALAQRVESAAQAAGMNLATLEGLYPQPSRRHQQSSLVEYPTILTWRSVELAQLLMVLYDLSEDGELTLSELRLRTPHAQSDLRLWDVEVTVSYRAFEPLSPSEPQP